MGWSVSLTAYAYFWPPLRGGIHSRGEGALLLVFVVLFLRYVFVRRCCFVDALFVSVAWLFYGRYVFVRLLLFYWCFLGLMVFVMRYVYVLYLAVLLAAALAGKATKGEPGAAIVGILRVDVAGVEAQVVAIGGIS